MTQRKFRFHWLRGRWPLVLVVSLFLSTLRLLVPLSSYADTSASQPVAWSTTLAQSAAVTSTVAGSDSASVADGVGAAASLLHPSGMSVHGGFGYFLDSHYIRAVSLATGTVSTVAGSGDDGCADSSDPGPVTIGYTSDDLVNDGQYLYFVDNTCRTSYSLATGFLRRMSLATGVVSLFPGRVPASHVTVGPPGQLIVSTERRLSLVDPVTGSVTTLADLPNAFGNHYQQTSVVGLGADQEFVYATTTTYAGSQDWTVITRVNASTGAIADIYSQRLGGTDAVAAGPIVSAGAYLYINAGRRIVRITKSDGSYAQIAGSGTNGFRDGTGAEAWLSTGTGIDIYGTSLVVTDAGNHRIRRLSGTTPLPAAQPPARTATLSMNTAVVSTLAGAGSAGTADGSGPAAAFSNVRGMSTIGGFGYVIDAGRIRRVALATGAVTTIAGGGTGQCTNSENPQAASVGYGDNTATDGTFLYWLDRECGAGGGLGTVRRMSLSSRAVSTLPGPVYGDHLTVSPSGQLVTATVNTISTVDAQTGQATSLATLPDLTYRQSIDNQDIRGLTADGDHIYATASTAGPTGQCSGCPAESAVSKIDISTGTVTSLYVQPDGLPENLAGSVVSAGSYLYVASHSGKILRMSKTTGVFAVVAGSNTTGNQDGLGASSKFASVDGLDSDGTNLWATDTGNYTIRKLGVALPVSVLPSEGGSSYPVGGVGMEESPGSGNLSELCGCGQGQETGNPVNTATGVFWHKFDDLATPGRGVAAHVSRTYVSSLAGRDSLFGRGWVSNLDVGLTVDPASGNVSVHQEDGSQVAFVPDGSGGYTPIRPRIFASLSEDSGGVYTFTRGKRLIFKFGPKGSLTSVRDLNGNVTSLGYDGSGNLQTVTDPAGRVYAFIVTGGHVTKVTDPAGRAFTYGYAGGDLTAVTDPTTAKWTFTYDSSHRLLTMLNPNQQGTASPSPLTNVYDGSGRVTKQTDFAGRATVFDYTAIAGATKVTHPVGDVTVDYYHNGQRTKSTAGYGTGRAATTSFTYDPVTAGVTSVTDPLGHTTSSSYDSRGNVLTVTDPLSRTTTTTYDVLNDPVTSTDPKGTTTTRTFDSRGNLTSSAAPLKSAAGTVIATRKTTFQRGDNTHPDDVTGIVSPNGNTTRNVYDSFGDLTSSTASATPENPAGNKTTYTYDTATGWRLSATSPRGNLPGATAADFTTSYTYDNDGRPTRTRDSLWSATAPSQHQITMTYDKDGNLVTRTNGKAQLTRYGYNANNELITTTLPYAPATRQTWTANGQVATTTDAAGRVTTNTYDVLGNLATVTDPLNRTTTYTHDAAGNLTLRAAAGATCTGPTPTTGCTKYSYDDADQLIARSYLDGVTHAVTGITYDTTGLRTTQTDATGTGTATYDNLGRLTAYQNGSGATTNYGYDLNGNPTTTSYPGTGHTVSRTYDALDRQASLTDWASNTVRFGYDADSNPTTSTFPTASGEVDTTTYNNLGAISQIAQKRTVGGTTSTLAGFTYTRDGASLIGSATTTGITEAPQTYSHDTLSRLTTSGSSSTPTSYDYSTSHDVLNRGTTSGGTASTQTFNAGNELCWSQAATLTSPVCGTVPTGATTYIYDTNGNRTTTKISTATPTTYGYDEEQQLTKHTPPTGAATTYTYDGDGLRQTKTVGSTVSRFTWDTSSGLPQLLSDGANYYLYDNTGTPIEQINTSTGATTWLHHDQLGSTRLLTNTTGTTVGTATYDPYGKRTATTGTATTPLGYNGQYTDTETGLIYLRARYYDPTTAQFLTIDPLLARTGQPYTYADDNPIDGTDPTGLECSGVWGCLGAHALSADAGMADMVTFGLVEKLDETLSPGSTCTYEHDAYFTGGQVAAVAAPTGAVILRLYKLRAAAKAAQAARGVVPSIGAKVGRQMGSRGWTEDAIQEAMSAGKRVKAVNKQSGNPATRYIHPTTGQSVVIDDVTGEVIHVGGPGFFYGPGSGDVP